MERSVEDVEDLTSVYVVLDDYSFRSAAYNRDATHRLPVSSHSPPEANPFTKGSTNNKIEDHRIQEPGEVHRYILEAEGGGGAISKKAHFPLMTCTGRGSRASAMLIDSN